MLLCVVLINIDKTYILKIWDIVCFTDTTLYEMGHPYKCCLCPKQYHVGAIQREAKPVEILSSCNHHWLRWWFVVLPTPSHYLNQCWNIVNWAIANKFQWHFNQNVYIFIHENAFEIVVCEISAILSRHQSINPLRLSDALWRRQHVV